MLKVWQYQEIDSDSIADPIERMIIYVAILEELDVEEVEEWSASKLVDKYNSVYLANTISESYKEKISIEKKELTLIDFSLISLGQFIDIEEWIKDGTKKNFHKIVSALYVIQESNGIKENTVEKYAEINVPYRSELIQDLPINDVHGAVQSYLSFREKFFKSYDIFEDPFKGVDVENLDEEERKIYEEDKAKLVEDDKNKWMKMLNILSGNDVTKFNKILKMNLFLAFNQLSYIIAESKK